MNIIETGIDNLLVIEPHIYRDNRGYFFESFNKLGLEKKGIVCNFVQDNQSYSKYGVIRGLHYQLDPFAQTKLVRAIKGKILDVAVDLRVNSITFGKVYSIELSDNNFKQLLIPQGFAHGFSVLSENAIVSYKCNSFYNKEAERGIMFNDTKLNIDWKIPSKDIKVSEKDLQNQLFENAQINF